MSPKPTYHFNTDILARNVIEGPREPEWYDEMFPELDEDFDDDELEEEFEYDNEDY